MRPPPEALVLSVPSTLGEAAQAVSRHLQGAGIDGSNLDARLLVSFGADMAPETILIYPETELGADERDRIETLVARRIAREPMSHILGEREFWSMNFEVTPDTLTPRPDTECLVETALGVIRGSAPSEHVSILDLGTGSGCILLALLSELPNANGVGVDLNAGALAVAQRNAKRHGLEQRVDFVSGSWFSGVRSGFDLIVSNPPYIESGEIGLLEPEVAEYEPLLALDGGPDGLGAYREICANAATVLNVGGTVVLEIGMSQSQAVTEILEAAGFLSIRTCSDLAGRDRIVMATCPKIE